MIANKQVENPVKLASKGKILVIDDNTDLCKLVTAILEEAGYTVATAEDGGQGLGLAKADPPDLILLDIMMPKMNGTDVLRLLKGGKICPDGVKVVMLTCKDSADEKVMNLNLGADDYIVKPYNPAELLARVDRQISIRGSEVVVRDALIESEHLAAIGDTVTVVVRDLNRFISNAMNSLDWMKSVVPDSSYTKKFIEYHDVAVKSMQAATTLVKGITLFSQGGNKQSRGKISILIRVATVVLMGKMKRAEVNLVTRIDEDPLIICNAAEIQMVLLAVLNNTMEAMKNTVYKKVSITTNIRDGRLYVSISDIGRGVETKDRPYIFNKFFSTQEGAKGLGLFFAMSIMIKHGGALNYMPSKTKGSIFNLIFPLVAKEGEDKKKEVDDG